VISALHHFRKGLIFIGGRDECERIGAQQYASSILEAYGIGVKSLANNRINGFTFLPLARKGLFLRCRLDVLFLRREKPGPVDVSETNLFRIVTT
jgi:hypothetical protein